MTSLCGQFFPHGIIPEVGTGRMVALSLVKQQRETVLLALAVQGEGGRDHHVFREEADGAPGYGV